MAAYSSIGRTSALFAVFFVFLFPIMRLCRRESRCLVVCVGDGVDMGAPFHVVVDVDIKVLCAGDVFNGMSMQLM